MNEIVIEFMLVAAMFLVWSTVVILVVVLLAATSIDVPLRKALLIGILVATIAGLLLAVYIRVTYEYGTMAILAVVFYGIVGLVESRGMD